MQVSKGLQEAALAEQPVRYHLGTLNFCSHFELSMASPKDFKLNAPRVPGPGALPSPEKIHATHEAGLPEIQITLV